MAVDLSQISDEQQPTTKAKGRILFNDDFLSMSFGSRLSEKHKGSLFRELQVLIDAGMDLSQCIQVLLQEGKHRGYTLVLQNLYDSIVKGENLSTAMEKDGSFSTYEYSSIRIGEKTGDLVQVMSELAEFSDKKTKLKRQLIGAISYPAFVLIVTVGAVYFMLAFIVPMFADVFSRFGSELPYLTQVMIKISNFLSTSIFWILAVILIVFAILFSQRKESWFRRLSSRLVLAIPFFGPLIQKIYLARFARSMHLLSASKTPLSESLLLVEQMIGFYPLEKALHESYDDVLRGTPLYQAFGKYEIFSNKMISIIRVGEEVNALAKLFDQLATALTDEVEHKTGLVGSILEPVLIVFIAGIVGLILLAMYMPLFDLSNTIG